MGKTVLILGGGTSGVAAANVLRKLLGEQHRILVVDRGGKHYFQAAYPLLMAKLRNPEQITRSLDRLQEKGVEFIQAEVEELLPSQNQVKTTAGLLRYDYLIVALGAELHPEAVPGQKETAYNPYDIHAVHRLQRELEFFRSGTIVLFIASLPYTGAVGPYEIIFLIDAWLRRRKVRSQARLIHITPEPALFPFAGRKVSSSLEQMLRQRDISLITNAAIQAVDKQRHAVILADGRAIFGDLLIGVPAHTGPLALKNGPLVLDEGWCAVSPHTLHAKIQYGDGSHVAEAENIFCVGDAAAIRMPANGMWAPKAGIFAHFQAEVVARNIALSITGQAPRFRYRSKGAGAVMISGFNQGRILSIDYYASPPRTAMLWPSAAAYLAKAAFEKYWLKYWLY
ncbi:MAG TPA: FAD-dependent oxidoreductase [Limnochordia bacterium]|nr:FAD-dependent oxidoreductase [Limnochordia bacterium]HQD70685.1 FAD-dependent oxidoreductase [Limnochordia bacterium]HXK97288.1 FAD-dependent oxidoreductase [Limnochordia bacterium]